MHAWQLSLSYSEAILSHDVTPIISFPFFRHLFVAGYMVKFAPGNFVESPFVMNLMFHFRLSHWWFIMKWIFHCQFCLGFHLLEATFDTHQRSILGSWISRCSKCACVMTLIWFISQSAVDRAFRPRSSPVLEIEQGRADDWNAWSKFAVALWCNHNGEFVVTLIWWYNGMWKDLLISEDWYKDGVSACYRFFTGLYIYVNRTGSRS